MGATTDELHGSSIPAAVAAAIEALAAHPAVVAITLGGSRASGTSDHASDHDIEVFVDGEILLDVRQDLALRFDAHPEIGNTWFGPADEWSDQSTGIAVDIAYFERAWFETTVRNVIERHQPTLGYTTAFWHTLRHAEPAFDRSGWLAEMRELAAAPYPDELRRNIVAWNHQVLRGTRSSYYRQIELAVQRDDPVSINHRVAALLASAFDIVFALARELHPGEKRLLAHVARLGDEAPEGFAHQVRDVVSAGSDMEVGDLLPALDALCNVLDEAIHQHGLWDATQLERS